jgi:ATP-dependent RNA helicase DeaD
MGFTKIKIDPKVLEAIKELNFIKPTEIQEKVLPLAIEGRDLVGQSMTGSGKTLAFAVPIIQNIQHNRGVEALILAPTRELANQTFEHLKMLSKYKKIKVAEVFGGVSIEPQIHALRDAEVVVGTPGRIIDHLTRGTVSFRNVKILVLDEADRMLDMGFIDDITRIIKTLPKERQTMLFSATMPDEIMHIATKYMRNPVRIQTQRQVAKHLLKQYYYDVKSEHKISLLVHLIKKEDPKLAIVFCGTRGSTDVVANQLQRFGIEAKAIHGGHEQAKRMRVLEGFHEGTVRILVATDVAARGLDIKNVSHVFNFDIPKTVDEYQHRIGRTARIGAEGKAISLLSKNDHDVFRKIVQRFDIEKLFAKDFMPKFISLRSEESEHRGYRRGPPRGGFQRRRRY